MEELSPTEMKDLENSPKENCSPANFLSGYGESFQKVFKKVVVFICYGPGVLGFLWLIGRILKR